jgi:hypothetical protein
MPEKKPRRRPPSRRIALRALVREDVRAVDDLIARWQALPPERRTQFLRVRRRLAPGSYL